MFFSGKWESTVGAGFKPAPAGACGVRARRQAHSHAGGRILSSGKSDRWPKGGFETRPYNHNLVCTAATASRMSLCLGSMARERFQ
jgi:hypothetical protein